MIFKAGPYRELRRTGRCCAPAGAALWAALLVACAQGESPARRGFAGGGFTGSQELVLPAAPGVVVPAIEPEELPTPRVEMLVRVARWSGEGLPRRRAASSPQFAPLDGLAGASHAVASPDEIDELLRRLGHGRAPRFPVKERLAGASDQDYQLLVPAAAWRGARPAANDRQPGLRARVRPTYLSSNSFRLTLGPDHGTTTDESTAASVVLPTGHWLVVTGVLPNEPAPALGAESWWGAAEETVDSLFEARKQELLPTPLLISVRLSAESPRPAAKPAPQVARLLPTPAEEAPESPEMAVFHALKKSAEIDSETTAADADGEESEISSSRRNSQVEPPLPAIAPAAPLMDDADDPIVVTPRDPEPAVPLRRTRTAEQEIEILTPPGPHGFSP